MNELTALELKILNSISQRLNPTVTLGNTLNEIIGCVGETGTPVNAVAATEILTISGVCVDGETLTIGADVYELLADAAQSKTVPTHIAVDIAAKTTNAVGTLTIAAQPTSGDTFTIGNKTYIFVPVGTANAVGEISIGADLAAAQLAIVAAINGTDGVNAPHPAVTAAAFAANACTITALVGGTVGNAIVTTETFTAGTNVFAAATLTTGADCTAANATTLIVAAITASDTQGVGAVKGTGSTVVLTADTAGVVGNAITVSGTMANASFPAGVTKLSGGVDGTVAVGTKFMVDETYLYTCLNGNTKSGKNWRRVSLGSAY